MEVTCFLASDSLWLGDPSQSMSFLMQEFSNTNHYSQLLQHPHHPNHKPQGSQVHDTVTGQRLLHLPLRPAPPLYSHLQFKHQPGSDYCAMGGRDQEQQADALHAGSEAGKAGEAHRREEGKESLLEQNSWLSVAASPSWPGSGL